jgi:hypothetical protein
MAAGCQIEQTSLAGVELDGQALDAGSAIPAAVDAFVPLPEAGPLPTVPDIAHETGRTPRQCVPGVYVGEFTCTALDFIPWGGKLSLELQRKEEGAGEFKRLVIVPGTTIEGTSVDLGMFVATLEGELDCDSGKLVGNMVNGSYKNPFIDEDLAGALSADYRADATPQFQGLMGPLHSPTLGDFSPRADCTWTASKR